MAPSNVLLRTNASERTKCKARANRCYQFSVADILVPTYVQISPIHINMNKKKYAAADTIRELMQTRLIFLCTILPRC